MTAQHGLIYDALKSKFGADGARVYGEASLAAVKVIERLVHDHSIDCDWERRPSYAHTEQDANVRQIEKEVEAAQAAGLPAHHTEQTELPWPVKAAVRFDDQAQFQPRSYCLALAHLIDGDGKTSVPRSSCSSPHPVPRPGRVLRQVPSRARIRDGRPARRARTPRHVHLRRAADPQRPPAPIPGWRARDPRRRKPQDRPRRRHRRPLRGVGAVRA